MKISLTPEELKKPYAKYFDEPYPEVPSRVTEQMAEPLDPLVIGGLLL